MKNHSSKHKRLCSVLSSRPAKSEFASSLRFPDSLDEILLPVSNLKFFCTKRDPLFLERLFRAMSDGITSPATWWDSTKRFNNLDLNGPSPDTIRNEILGVINDAVDDSSEGTLTHVAGNRTSTTDDPELTATTTSDSPGHVHPSESMVATGDRASDGSSNSEPPCIIITSPGQKSSSASRGLASLARREENVDVITIKDDDDDVTDDVAEIETVSAEIGVSGADSSEYWTGETPVVSPLASPGETLGLPPSLSPLDEPFPGRALPAKPNAPLLSDDLSFSQNSTPDLIINFAGSKAASRESSVAPGSASKQSVESGAIRSSAESSPEIEENREKNADFDFFFDSPSPPPLQPQPPTQRSIDDELSSFFDEIC